MAGSQNLNPRRSISILEHSYPLKGRNGSVTTHVLNGTLPKRTLSVSCLYESQYDLGEELGEINFPTAESSPLPVSLNQSDIPETEFLERLLADGLGLDRIRELVRARLKQRKETSGAEHTKSLSVLGVAVRRTPAILVTVALELLVGVVVSRFSTLIARHPEIVSFLPMISSICGNIGLQSSASTMHAVIGGIMPRQTMSLVRCTVMREVKIASLLGLGLCCVLCVVVLLWTSSFKTGIVSGVSVLISASGAAVMGSAAPLIFKRLGFDPALCAGPFETALEDVLGISVFLLMALWILN